jgi:hypothetical protein
MSEVLASIDLFNTVISNAIRKPINPTKAENSNEDYLKGERKPELGASIKNPARKCKDITRHYPCKRSAYYWV